jgi:hypothetical protein
VAGRGEKKTKILNLSVDLHGIQDQVEQCGNIICPYW